MSILNHKAICAITALSIISFAGGCAEPGAPGGTSRLLGGPKDLGDTIGSLAVIYSPALAVVEGYGLVGSLRGTGSSECPTQLRAYLKRYIVTQMPEHRINVDKLIASRNTAVVHIQGQLPPLASKTSRFDVVVTALSGTQTTSLQGGWLYGTELRVALGTRAVGNAAGPIYTDKIGEFRPSQRSGFVLGGAKAFEDYKLHLALKKPDYKATSDVRNRINERFGPGVAKAVLPGRIELTVPPRYAKRRHSFASIVEATYLAENPEINKERIMAMIRELAVAENKFAAEAALEAIGYESLSKLAILLNSSDERVRLHAARCMLNLGSDKGLGTLIKIALDTSSAVRIEALKTLTTSARRNDAATIATRLLRDSDFDVRLAAYEQLRELEDPVVVREVIARSFHLEQIAHTEYKGIFASRSDRARIVLFGAPIRCAGNIFVQSEDGSIILNAPAGQTYVSVIRKHPARTTAHLRSSFDLADIIRTLCEEPPTKSGDDRGGLGVSYSEMIALVKQLSDKRVVAAEFRAGLLPKSNVNVKK